VPSSPSSEATSPRGSARNAASIENFVEVRDVDLVYGRDEDRLAAVEGLNFKINKGDFVAVVGPSGCGKSSLMKLITGLLPPTAGEIFIGGEKVRGPVRGVGMAFQNSTLMPWRTTLDNVLLPFEIVANRRGMRRDKKAYIAKAEQILELVGLGSFGKKYPWQLSGGMQQRANLCRALIHEPDLLMLDEPFGALDAFTREELWGVMQKLWIDRRFTAVLVTHDLREAVYLADTVFVMSWRPGRIIYVRKIDVPRPRSLDTTFDPHFIEIVRDLREKIRQEQDA
jgi:NitT/TauT family transport system ATP-binding protein